MLDFFNFSMIPKSPENSPPPLQPLRPGTREPRAHFDEVKKVVAEAEQLRADLSAFLSPPAAPPAPPAQAASGQVPGKIREALAAIGRHGLGAVKWADGFTALHWAAENGNLEICQFLLTKNADPAAQDRQGRTPLDLAARGNHAEVFSLLSDYVENYSGVFEKIPPQFSKALEAIRLHGWRSLKWAGGWSALHWAAQEGRLDVVRFLVGVGAPAGLADKAGRIPAFYAQKKGHGRIVEFLNSRI